MRALPEPNRKAIIHDSLCRSSLQRLGVGLHLQTYAYEGSESYDLSKQNRCPVDGWLFILRCVKARLLIEGGDELGRKMDRK